MRRNLNSLSKLVLICLFSITLFGCQSEQGKDEDILYYQIGPPEPQTIEEVFEYLNGNSSERDLAIQAALEYEQYYDELIPMIGSIIKEDSDVYVRQGAAWFFSELGPRAEAAVPDLLWLLHNEDCHHCRRWTIIALGEVKQKETVPSLVHFLYDPDKTISWLAASAISSITGVIFTDANENGFTISDEGISHTTLEAREWWKAEGQYHNWEEDGE